MTVGITLDRDHLLTLICKWVACLHTSEGGGTCGGVGDEEGGRGVGGGGKISTYLITNVMFPLISRSRNRFPGNDLA